MDRKYRSDEQVAKRIYRSKDKVMSFDEALEKMDKFLSSWFEAMAPRFQWFEVDGGEFELFIEPNNRGDFVGLIHVRRAA